MEIFERVKAILFNPKEEWMVIEAENAPHATVFTKYLLILALIPTLAFFAKEYLNNRSMLNDSISTVENTFRNNYFNSLDANHQAAINEQIAKNVEEATEKFPLVHPFNTTKWSIIFAVCLFAIIVGGAYIAAAIINALSNQFGAEKDFNRAFSLVAYSLTPLCIAGILYLFHSFASFIPYIGLYGLYLLYLGIEPLLKPAADKKMTGFIISAIVIVAVLAALTKVVVPEIQKKVMTEEYVRIAKEGDKSGIIQINDAVRKVFEKQAELELENHKY